MKKQLSIAAIMLSLAFTSGQILPALAAEEATPPPAAIDSKKDGTPPKNADAAPKEDGGGDAKSKKATDVSGGHFAGDPVYVHLPPMTLPILGNTGPEQLVTVQITVQVRDMDAADSIHTNMPRVMDALVQSLYGGLGSGNLRNGRLVDISKVKNKAMLALQNVQGNDSIKDVLIVNMSQRLL